MEKGVKIAFLISAVIAFIIFVVVFIGNFTDEQLAADKEAIKSTFIRILPFLLSYLFIAFLWLADLTDKKIKFEKVYDALLALLYVPFIIEEIGYLQNLRLNEHMINSLSEKISSVFGTLLLVSIILSLIIRIVNNKKMRIFNIIFYSVSLSGYLFLPAIFSDYSKFSKPLNSILLVFLYFPFLGISLARNKPNKTEDNLITNSN